MGVRVPLIVLSPWVEPGLIDSRVYDFSSVLRFIERLHGLPALSRRDRQANAMLGMFDFDQEPLEPLMLSPRDCR
jgi:phospholipase C